jgi:hypothetical protein
MELDLDRDTTHVCRIDTPKKRDDHRSIDSERCHPVHPERSGYTHPVLERVLSEHIQRVTTGDAHPTLASNRVVKARTVGSIARPVTLQTLGWSDSTIVCLRLLILPTWISCSSFATDSNAWRPGLNSALCARS